MPTQHAVAVVGGGLSGLLLALQLLDKGPDDLTVALVERSPGFGVGLAYSTHNPEHLLNVRVGNMSAFPDRPRHLVEWLSRRTTSPVDEASFISRATYGSYLQSLLADTIRQPSAASRLILVPDEAVRLDRRRGGMSVTLAMGTQIEAQAVALTIGPLSSGAPFPGLEGLPAALYSPDPWSPGALDDLAPDAPVLLLGTGLTMVDVALSLAGKGHTGPILALSRRGLAPHSHATHWPAIQPIAAIPALPLSRLVGWVREAGEARGWRTAIDALRPHTTAFWQAASPAERARFLRHLRPWWDVHRHRMAPPVAERIATLRDRGQLDIRAGRLVRIAPEGDRATATWTPRGAAGEDRGVFHRVINCTGAGADLRGPRSALLRSLMARGEVRLDGFRLGLDVEPSGRATMADGAPHPHLFALGPVTRGAFWESIAAPDIRNQAADLAARLVAEVESRTLAA